ncbi:hypothetical protein ABFT23_18300 [Nocardioides sp. C4-1]|uniref:hypothetical protein n=1 Tax=Nocardioides sp. C4-1 TaxID=3151851 RepID=UPI003263AF6F
MGDHRRKRDTDARGLWKALSRPRATVIAGPLAVMATAGAVTIGVLGADVATTSMAAPGPVAGETATTAASLAGVIQRRPSVSRGLGGDRAGLTGADAQTPAPAPKPKAPTKSELMMKPAAVKKAVTTAKKSDTMLWTTEALNLWDEPGEKAGKTGEVQAGKQVLVTGRELFGRVEIVWEETETRWVTAGYLTEDEPFTLGGDCTNGTSVPSGVSENIKKVHDAVCAEFPDIMVYGTFRGDGEHSQGIAVDIMVSGDEGWKVAEFVRQYYRELGVSYLIYSQQIWSVQRSGEGWRGMSDRGSMTANHYDHVHVTTY